jgi:anti-sigma B factor antagonist
LRVLTAVENNMPLIDVKLEGEATVVELLTRRLDAAVALSFKDSVLGIVKSGRTRLVLDMSAVQFVDSSGLGALVSILKDVGVKGVLTIAEVQPALDSLLKLTRMDKVFAIVPTVPQAVAKVTG